jgi:hypothetical protein
VLDAFDELFTSWRGFNPTGAESAMGKLDKLDVTKIALTDSTGFRLSDNVRNMSFDALSGMNAGDIDDIINNDLFVQGRTKEISLRELNERLNKDVKAVFDYASGNGELMRDFFGGTPLGIGRKENIDIDKAETIARILNNPGQSVLYGDTDTNSTMLSALGYTEDQVAEFNRQRISRALNLEDAGRSTINMFENGPSYQGGKRPYTVGDSVADSTNSNVADTVASMAKGHGKSVAVGAAAFGALWTVSAMFRSLEMDSSPKRSTAEDVILSFAAYLPVRVPLDSLIGTATTSMNSSIFSTSPSQYSRTWFHI